MAPAIACFLPASQQCVMPARCLPSSSSSAGSTGMLLGSLGRERPPKSGGRMLWPQGLLVSIPLLPGALVRLENSISITGRVKAAVSQLGRQPRHSFPFRNPSQSLEHPRIYLPESWRPPINEAAIKMLRRGARRWERGCPGKAGGVVGDQESLEQTCPVWASDLRSRPG